VLNVELNDTMKALGQRRGSGLGPKNCHIKCNINTKKRTHQDFPTTPLKELG
jgi:hypothetical protein